MVKIPYTVRYPFLPILGEMFVVEDNDGIFVNDIAYFEESCLIGAAKRNITRGKYAEAGK